MKKIVLTLAFLALPLVAAAQTPAVPKNPTTLMFTPSTDDAQVTAYEVDIVQTSDGAVIQTLSIPRESFQMLATGDLQTRVNVQPVKFGHYVVKVRAVATALKSEDSLPSNEWERVPGAPSRPTVQ